MEKNSHRIFLWILLGVIPLGLFGIYNWMSGTIAKRQDNFISTEEYQQTVVKNASEFFTVSNCITKYVTFLQAKEKDKIYVLLDQNYINQNEITEENVLSFVPEIVEGAVPKCLKMYKKRVNEQVVSYYVHFQVEENVFEEVGKKQDMYAIVYLMENKSTFSVEPYDGEVFIHES